MKELGQAMVPQRRAVAELLVRMRRELQRLELWEARPPAPHRLASDQPFSWDTLGFYQWLQWRFLPRMGDVLEGREDWPLQCAIHPYAEECLSGCAEDTRQLLFLIETLDELLSGEPFAGTDVGAH
jgi:uncharacterized protein YqcC (DUF446 family)